MTHQPLEYIEVPVAQGAPNGCVIWLHGLGASGHDFEPAVEALGLPQDHGIRFIFPHAPQRPVTLNQHMVMPAWFDIIALDKEAPQDEQGLACAQSSLMELIEAQIQSGVSSDRILLAGFSQGGAVALHTALRYPHPLAGVLGLSTYLPLMERLQGEIHSQNAQIPIWLAHGQMDMMLPMAWGEQAAMYLKSLGCLVQWQTYPMAHEVCVEELMNIGQWILERLG